MTSLATVIILVAFVLIDTVKNLPVHIEISILEKSMNVRAIFIAVQEKYIQHY